MSASSSRNNIIPRWWRRVLEQAALLFQTDSVERPRLSHFFVLFIKELPVAMAEVSNVVNCVHPDLNENRSPTACNKQMFLTQWWHGAGALPVRQELFAAGSLYTGSREECSHPICFCAQQVTMTAPRARWGNKTIIWRSYAVLLHPLIFNLRYYNPSTSLGSASFPTPSPTVFPSFL